MHCQVITTSLPSIAHSLTRSFTHSRTHSLTHSLIHPLTHSLTYSFTHSLAHSLIFFLFLFLSHLDRCTYELLQFRCCKYEMHFLRNWMQTWCIFVQSHILLTMLWIIFLSLSRLIPSRLLLGICSKIKTVLRITFDPFTRESKMNRTTYNWHF